MIRLGRVASLAYALLDLVGALVADLRVALLEIPAIAVVISIELFVVGVGRVVGQVLRQAGREEALVFEAYFAKDNVWLDSGGGLGFGIL